MSHLPFTRGMRSIDSKGVGRIILSLVDVFNYVQRVIYIFK